MKSRSPGFHRSDLPTGNPQSKSDGAIIEQRPFTVNDTLASPEKRPPRLPLRESPLGSCHRDGTFGTGDTGVPVRRPALTPHDAELRPRSVQDSSKPTDYQEMKRPLAGSVSRRPLRVVRLRPSALTYDTDMAPVVRPISPEMQSPPRRTAKGLFLHMVDEADMIVAKSAMLSSGPRGTVADTPDAHEMAASAERRLSSFDRR
jgi:hypothetical protein